MQVMSKLADFDSTRLYLGNLCNRNHSWGELDKSSRYKSTGGCVECIREKHPGRKSRLSVEKRFWSKVQILEKEDCWEWTGNIHPKTGYGHFTKGDKSFLAHRIAYELHYQEKPGKLLVCHKCDNRKCCNSSHLFLGTHKDNNADAAVKGRTARGEKNVNQVLTEEQVLVIRSRIMKGEKQLHLSKEYQVSVSTINSLWHRLTWKHI